MESDFGPLFFFRDSRSSALPVGSRSERSSAAHRTWSAKRNSSSGLSASALSLSIIAAAAVLPNVWSRTSPNVVELQVCTCLYFSELHRSPAPSFLSECPGSRFRLPNESAQFVCQIRVSNSSAFRPKGIIRLLCGQRNNSRATPFSCLYTGTPRPCLQASVFLQDSQRHTQEDF